MKERQITGEVLKYVRDNFKHSCAVECKVSNGDSIAFSALQPHQEQALLIATHSCLYHKISDAGAYAPLPFDGFVLCGVPAYVALRWKGRGITIITIQKWIQEREASKRKSLTYDRAFEIAKRV